MKDLYIKFYKSNSLINLILLLIIIRLLLRRLLESNIAIRNILKVKILVINSNRPFKISIKIV